MSSNPTPRVLIVGGGFAGVGCAHELAKRDVPVTLVDRNNYHQFQPLLYQVATAQLASSDVANPLRGIFRKTRSVDVKKGEVTAVDPVTRTVTLEDGTQLSGDYLVLALGSQPNFFQTPGAEEHSFPLYSVDDAERLRSRVFEVFEDADRNRSLLDRGALNFVIVGGGPTGVETAGALADLVNNVMPHRFRDDVLVHHANLYLVDLGHVLLAAFSDKAHEYAAKVLQREGVHLKLGVSAKQIAPDRVVLSDGTEILTRCVVWGGGIMAPTLAGRSGLPQGRGGRFDVQPDLSIEGFAGVYAVGDVANIPSSDGTALPQLGSVALQAGRAAGDSIMADITGKSRPSFRYHDKGIMAMIGHPRFGRGAAVAEMGAHHHELHGPIAFAAWLGVHAWLLNGIRAKVDAFISWGWDYFSSNRAASSIIDRPDAARIDWSDNESADDSAEVSEGKQPEQVS